MSCIMSSVLSDDHAASAALLSSVEDIPQGVDAPKTGAILVLDTAINREVPSLYVAEYKLRMQIL